MNYCHFIGRTTKAPEVRYTQGDKPTVIANFTLAVQRKFSKDKVDFIDCVAFGKTAEFLEKYIGQGDKIAVTGSLQIEPYTDKNGVKRYPAKIYVIEVDFAQSKTEDVQKGEKVDADGFMNIPDGIDESALPFN